MHWMMRVEWFHHVVEYSIHFWKYVRWFVPAVGLKYVELIQCTFRPFLNSLILPRADSKVSAEDPLYLIHNPLSIFREFLLSENFLGWLLS